MNREYRVEDILDCRECANGGVNFENFDLGFRSSHCDIVTRMLSEKIETTGGNLSDSMLKDTVSIDNTGRITERDYCAVFQVGVRVRLKEICHV